MWFEELAFKLLKNPAQQAVIQALRATPEPVTEADLQVLIEGLGYRGYKHHLERLRKLHAIELKVSSTGPVRIWYQLTKRPGRD
jgi:DNA-binding transcriptional ArsR family regulator